MPLRLVHLSGSLAGRARVLDASEELILGRDPLLAQIVFGPDDRLVSRRHASVCEKGEVLILRDLESSTGTFVDGESVYEAELGPGDVFELGPGGPRVRVESESGQTLVAVASGPSPDPATEGEDAPPSPPGSRLRITVTSGPRKGESVEPGGSVVRLGRGAANSLAFPEDRVVSAQHAKIVRLDEGFVLMDLESTNGTWLNGRRVTRARLRDGDRLMLGTGPTVAIEILPPPRKAGAESVTVVIPNFADLKNRRSRAVFVEEIPIPDRGLLVGRGEGTDVRLSSPMISRTHARVYKDGAATLVEDLGSTNGTYVRGERIKRQILSATDRVVVGPFELVSDGEGLRVFDTRRRTEVIAEHLSASAGGARILDDVSLRLRPASFTGIIGPSGSGKTTLMQALHGVRPAAEGRVLVNGVDLYSPFAATLKGMLGYVPQDDIIHGELTPAECLRYTAGLRLPPDTTEEERARRIADVLHTLELTERQHVPVQRLSGGQRKRVSIAVELLTEPDVLFLDEPTSGLDPGLEESLMLLLRELSFKGKTIVVVTHALEHIDLCDEVALLMSGRMAFCGSVTEARQRFRVAHMSQLYARLRERPGSTWSPPPTPGVAAETRSRPAPSPDDLRALTTAAARPSALRQLRVLGSRYLRTLTRDRRNALLLIGQAPLVAALIGLSLRYGAADIAYTKPKNTLLFLVALTAVWFGCSNAARELVKERAIFIREQMVGLRSFPYVLSKVSILVGLAALQCSILLLILDHWYGIPGSKPVLLAATTGAALEGVLLGLLISAVSRTADRAITLLPMVLIPQVLFTFPAVQLDMKGPAGTIAQGMPTWWGYDLLRRIALAPDQATADEDIDARLAQHQPVLMNKSRFESMLKQGFPMWNYRNTIEITWSASAPERWSIALPAFVGAWAPAVIDVSVMAAMGVGLLFATAYGQRRASGRLR